MTLRKVLEQLTDDWRSLRIGHQTLAERLRRVDVADGCEELQRPNSSAAVIPARVRSDRTSLSNCANEVRTPSINFPVEVSSIGSVAERNEMPSDLR
jgi:hypothetical protein